MSKYYISKNGNDNNNGSTDSPFKTLIGAFDNVIDGDTLEIKDDINLKNFVNNREYTFELGTGGKGGTYSTVRGGGGGGGVVVKKNGTVINPPVSAGDGGSANGGEGGAGGEGFGGGGGGGGFWYGVHRLLGGRGGNGLVYLWTPFKEYLIDSSQKITLSRENTFLGIFGMGGGGGGGTGRVEGDLFAGAGSGYYGTNILEQTLPKNTYIDVKIGNGGSENNPPTNGEQSIVTINTPSSISYNKNGYMDTSAGKFIKDFVSDDFESFGIQKLLNGDILAIMDNNSHIYRSSDKGRSWYRLPDLPFVKATYSHYAILSTGEIICLDNTINNRIWSSKDNGYSWTKVSDNAGLGDIQLSRFGMCVLPDDTIIMVGGKLGTNDTHTDDVWILDNTYQFSLQNSNPDFFDTVNNVTFNDGYTIYNVFGQSAVENSELWKSNDKGLTWEFVSDMVTQTGSARYGAGALIANNNIYITGGREKFVTNGGENSDVWQSSDGGYTWEQIDNIPTNYTVQAPGLIYYQPSTIVRISTASQNTLKQLRSDDNGYTWYEITCNAGTTASPSINTFGYTTLSDNTIIIAGGKDENGPTNSIWKSIDGGNNWNKIVENAEFANTYRNTLIECKNGDLLQFGGTNADTTVWRSTDKGLTWSNTNEFDFSTILSGESVIQNNAHCVLSDGTIVITSGTLSSSTRTNKVLKSIDDGKTFSLAADPAPYSSRYGSIMFRDSNDVIYVLGGVDGNDGWKSQDNGSTWTKIGDLPFGNYNRPRGVITEKDVMVVTAGISGSTYVNEVWVSYDYARTWIELETPTFMARYAHGISLQEKEIVVFFGTNSSSSLNNVEKIPLYSVENINSGNIERPLIYIFAGGINGSTDLISGEKGGGGGPGGANGGAGKYDDGNGKPGDKLPVNSLNSINKEENIKIKVNNFNTITSTPSKKLINVIPNANLGYDFIKLDNGEYLHIEGNKVNRSKDRGKNWDELSELPQNYQYHNLLKINNKIIVLGNINDNKFTYSTDNGKTWSANQTLPFTVEKQASVLLSDNSILVLGGKTGSDTNKKVYRSIDEGVSWDEISETSLLDRYNHNATVLQDGTVIVIGGEGKTDVISSSDGGVSWTTVNSNFGDFTTEVKNGAIASIGESIIWTNGYIDGSGTNKLYLSKDKGVSWETITLNLEGNYGGKILLEEKDQQIILISGNSKDIYKFDYETLVKGFINKTSNGNVYDGNNKNLNLIGNSVGILNVNLDLDVKKLSLSISDLIIKNEDSNKINFNQNINFSGLTFKLNDNLLGFNSSTITLTNCKFIKNNPTRCFTHFKVENINSLTLDNCEFIDDKYIATPFNIKSVGDNNSIDLIIKNSILGKFISPVDLCPFDKIFNLIFSDNTGSITEYFYQVTDNNFLNNKINLTISNNTISNYVKKLGNNVYYVKSTGDNTNQGNITNPFKDLKGALNNISDDNLLIVDGEINSSETNINYSYNLNEEVKDVVNGVSDSNSPLIELPNGDLLIFGSSIIKSTDNGKTWSSISSLNGSSDNIVIVRLSSGKLLKLGGGVNKNEREYSDDDGLTWTTMTTISVNLDKPRAVVTNDDTVVVMTDGNVYNTNNQGDTMVSVYSGDVFTGRNNFQVAYDSNINTIYVLGGDTYDMSDLWKSIDKGSTWTQVVTTDELNRHTLYSGQLLVRNNILIYGSGYISGLIKNEILISDDYGKNWSSYVINGYTGRYNGFMLLKQNLNNLFLFGGSQDDWNKVSLEFFEKSDIKTLDSKNNIVILGYNAKINFNQTIKLTNSNLTFEKIIFNQTFSDRYLKVNGNNVVFKNNTIISEDKMLELDVSYPDIINNNFKSLNVPLDISSNLLTFNYNYNNFDYIINYTSFNRTENSNSKIINMKYNEFIIINEPISIGSLNNTIVINLEGNKGDIGINNLFINRNSSIKSKITINTTNNSFTDLTGLSLLDNITKTTKSYIPTTYEDLYIDPTGNDDNFGISVINPIKSFNKSIERNNDLPIVLKNISVSINETNFIDSNNRILKLNNGKYLKVNKDKSVYISSDLISKTFMGRTTYKHTRSDICQDSNGVIYLIGGIDENGNTTKIEKSNNLGQSWSTIYTFSPSGYYRSLVLPNDVIIVVYDGGFFYSEDYAESFVKFKSDTNFSCTGILYNKYDDIIYYFSNSSSLKNYKQIGGHKGPIYSFEIINGLWIKDIKMLDENRILGIAENNRLIYSLNKGKNWTVTESINEIYDLNLKLDLNVHKILSIKDSNIIELIVIRETEITKLTTNIEWPIEKNEYNKININYTGDYNFSNGYDLKNNKIQQTHRFSNLISSDNDFNCYYVIMLNNGNLLGFGGNGNYNNMVKSIDKGNTWETISVNNPVNARPAFGKQMNDGTIFVGGGQSTEMRTSFYISNDEGKTWTSKTPNYDLLNTVDSLELSGEIHLLLSNGEQYYTTDKGDNWNFRQMTTASESYTVIDDVLYGIKSGNLYKSINKGVEWDFFSKSGYGDGSARHKILNVNDILFWFFEQSNSEFMYSIDKGKNWLEGYITNNNLPNSEFNLSISYIDEGWYYNKNILFRYGDNYGYLDMNYNSMNITNMSKIVFKNITINITEEPLFINNCSYVTFENVTFNDNLSNTRNYPFIKAHSGNNNLIFNNCIFNTNRFGISINNDVLIKNCIFNLNNSPGTDCIYIIVEGLKNKIDFDENSFESHSNILHNILFTDHFEGFTDYEIKLVTPGFNTNNDKIKKILKAPNGNIILFTKKNYYISKDSGSTWECKGPLIYNSREFNNFDGQIDEFNSTNNMCNVFIDNNNYMHFSLANGYMTTSLDNGENWEVYPSNVKFDSERTLFERNDGVLLQIKDSHTFNRVKKDDYKIIETTSVEISISMDVDNRTKNSYSVLRVFKDSQNRLVILDTLDLTVHRTTNNSWTKLEFLHNLPDNLTLYTRYIDNILYFFDSSYIYKSLDLGKTVEGLDFSDNYSYTIVEKLSVSDDIFLTFDDYNLIFSNITTNTKTITAFNSYFNTDNEIYDGNLNMIFNIGDDLLLQNYTENKYYISTDYGMTWSFRNNLNITGMVYPLSEGTWVILDDTDVSNVYHSTDNGLTATLEGSNIGDINNDGSNVFSGTVKFIASGNNLYSLTSSNGIYKSIDKGLTWTQINSSTLNTLFNDSNILHYTGFGISDNEFNILLENGYSYTTTNGGISFNQDKRNFKLFTNKISPFTKSYDGYYYQVVKYNNELSLFKSSNGINWEIILSLNENLQYLINLNIDEHPNCIKTKKNGYIINIKNMGIYKLILGNNSETSSIVIIYDNTFINSSNNVIGFNNFNKVREIDLTLDKNSGDIANSKFLSLNQNMLLYFKQIILENNNIINTLNGLLSLEKDEQGDLNYTDRLIKLVSNTNSNASDNNYIGIDENNRITKKNIDNDISSIIQELNKTEKQKTLPNLDYPVKSSVSIDKLKASRVEINFDNNLSFTNGFSIGNRKPIKIKYANNSGYSGIVSKLNINAFDELENQVTDFSDKPLLVRLSLPHANPSSNLIMLKTDGNGTILEPQPLNYPVSLTYQPSTELWKTELKTLSEFVVQDNDDPDGTSGGDPHIVNIYGKKITLPNNWRLINLYQKDNIKVLGKAEFIGDELSKKLHIYKKNKIMKADPNIHNWIKDYTYFTQLIIEIDKEYKFIFDCLKGKVIFTDNQIKYEKCNSSGLKSLTHGIIYPKKYHKAFNIYLPSGDYLTINIDIFWDDINSIDLTLLEYNKKNYTGEFFFHLIKHKEK